MTVYEWLSEASVWWWPRFADHLWQTTLFVLVVVLAAFALRRGPARLRHNLWLLASAKFIVPVALLVFFTQQTGIDSVSGFRATPGAAQNALLVGGVTEPVSAIASHYEVTVISTLPNDNQEVYFALTAIWLTGFAVLVFVWAIRRRKFLRSLRLSRRLQTGREWQALARARKALRLQTNVGLVISPLKIEPAAWRVWRPVVVMPESIANQLDDEELEAIMIHELVHIQRRDNLIGNLQLALCALLWFHPLVWVISRKLFDEREQACDERVMEVGGAPVAYASSILKVVRFCFGWKVAGVTGAASGSNLRRRIENIMSIGNTKPGASGASGLLAGALMGIALMVLVGAGIYSRAQNRIPSATDGGVVTVEITSDAEVAANIAADLPGSAVQKTRPAPPAPPTPPTPLQAAQPDQPPQPSAPPEPAQDPEPSQAPNPSQPPQPSRAPNPSSVPKPASAPHSAPAPEPWQGPKPAHLAPAGIGVGSGTGKGIGRGGGPRVATGFGRGAGVGVGGGAPAAAPSTVAPASPTAAPAPRALPAKQEKPKTQTREKGALIEAPHPVYPEEARQQKIEGTVAVTITIGEDGNVIFAKAKSGPEPLYGASQEAAYKARFKPTMKDGKPVKVAAVMSYNFVLNKK